MSRAWESAHSNEYELWSKVSDQQRGLLDTAKAIRPTDPDAAFRIYLDVADDGVAWAMEVVGYHYQFGWGTSGCPDFELAQTYYQRAIEAGSSMAMLRYAWLLANHGRFEISERLLQESAEAGFIPAYYWLARCHFRQSSDRRTCRDIKSLLVRAADAGHPAAAEMLARLRMRGKFGFREIPRALGRCGKSLAKSVQPIPRPTSTALPLLWPDRGPSEMRATDIDNCTLLAYTGCRLFRRFGKRCGRPSRQNH